MGTLALLVLFVAGLGVVVGVPLVITRASGPRVLRIVRVGSLGYAALIALVTIATVVPLAGGAGQVAVPLAGDPIRVPDRVTFDTGPVATIVGGGIDQATLALTHMGVGARVLLIAAAVTQAAVSIVIAVTLSRIATATLRGAPFLPAATRLILVTAVTIALGGTAAAIFQQVGAWTAGVDALQVTSWHATHVGTGTTLASLGWPEPSFTLQIPFLPILLGIGLTAIAAVFRTGERMQHDTAGLV